MVVPKFRAWDKVSRAWRHDVYIGLDGLAKDLSRTGEEPFELPLDNVIIMQTTGKMDSTGQVEVYAGDILYYPDQDEDNYGIIKFDEDTLAFVLDNGYERFVYGDYGMGKVIGNIYENPELVEGING